MLAVHVAADGDQQAGATAPGGLLGELQRNLLERDDVVLPTVRSSS
jgi:hypothetical protein